MVRKQKTRMPKIFTFVCHLCSRLSKGSFEGNLIILKIMVTVDKLNYLKVVFILFSLYSFVGQISAVC